jgi:hypothetical protein
MIVLLLGGAFFLVAVLWFADAFRSTNIVVTSIALLASLALFGPGLVSWTGFFTLIILEIGVGIYLQKEGWPV